MAEEMDDDQSSDLNENDPDEAMDVTEVENNRFQKENHLLKNLPYYKELQAETEEYLDKIITNLVNTILSQDFQIGVTIYTKSLKTYIVMYGRKFTKEQHIKLINLYVEIITSKECPLNIVNDVADVLNILLRKPELLTRDDITIAWRPLYDTVDRCIFHRKYTLSYNASAKLEALLKETVRLSNVYFEPGTVTQVLAEFSPMLCPTSPKMVFGLEMLKHFLPFLDVQAESEINEFMKHLLSYCDAWNNGPTWEWTVLSLFSTAAWNMPGSFDWTPYLPTMYARIMKNLELPVHFKGARNAARENSLKQFDYASVARWMVSTLGNRPQAIQHLCTFLKSLETYYNPTNHGKWTMPLGALLNELVSSFSLRLKKERYIDNKKRWWYRIQSERKLTDEEIDKFVKATSYIVLDFYLDLNICGFVLKNLACIRPNIIIPAILEKYEGIVETVTEPRKYMTTLRWVTIILLPLMSSRKEVEGYDGRKLVIPFALSLLPAIDPNDMYKTLSALGCLHGLFNLLPFVDCSSLAETLEDEDERELCLASGCLEDFLVQFLDRILNLIDSRQVENTRMADNRTINEGANVEDISLEKFIWAVFHRIATQSSTKICKAVIKKVVSFAFANTLETAVSGKLYASILQAFVVARPDIALPKILPQLCASIRSHISDEILDEEDIDKTLLFQLLLLSYITETDGVELLKYRSDIESTFDTVFKLNGKKGYTFASHALSRFLQSLVYIYPIECRISQADYDDPNYLAIRDWGATADPRFVKMNWHMPSKPEYDWAVEIFLKYFTTYSARLANVASFTESNADFNKTLLKNLQVLLSAYNGISTMLRFWDDVPVESEDSVADLSPDKYEFGFKKPDIFVPGTDMLISKKCYEMYTSVFDYLQAYKGDDVDAYIALMRGFDSLIFPLVESERRMVAVSKSSVSLSLQNTLDPKKKYTRGGLITRSYDVHMKRIRESRRCAGCTTWTKSHVAVLHSLFKLCINHYAKVRVNSQNRFFRVIESFEGLISRSVTSFFEPYLKEGTHHDEYKGTLYTMLGRSGSPLLHNSWAGLKQLWLALVHSPFSEKNSIIKIMERIKNSITQNFVYYPLQLRLSENAKMFDLAKSLLTKEQLSRLDYKIIKTPENPKIFLQLLNGLTEAGVDGNTHWRRQVMCANMLSVLIVDDPDVPVTKEMIEIFFDGLISHSIDIRRTTTTTLSWLLVLFKRQYPSVTVITKDALVLKEGESVHSVLQYKINPLSSSTTPTTSTWVLPPTNGHPATPSPYPIHIHKVHFGYSDLPSTLKIKLPTEDYSNFTTHQSSARSILLETTHRYLNNPDYLAKLLELWSLEDKTKTKSNKRASICKSIARNNGPDGVRLLVGLVHALGTDTDQWKQKCAADILCGIMYGMKLWNDEETNKFWEEALRPVFNDCLNSVTQETMDAWSVALQYPTIPFCQNLRCYPGSIADLLQALIGQMAISDSGSGRKARNVLNRDPNKMRFFIEFLRQRFIKSLETAQTTSVDAFKEMTFFDQVITNLQWRGGDLYVQTLDLVKKHFFDSPIPYMSVRTQLGRVLSTFFEWDVESPVPFNSELCPRYDTFVDFIFDRLSSLEEEAAKYQANEKDSEENAEIRKLLLKFKTAMEFIVSATWDNESSVHPSFFRFIPLFCQFESYDPDPEVSTLACSALAGLARTLINPKHMDTLFIYLNQASLSPSWRARLCVLEFLKVFALNNTSVFTTSLTWSHQVVDLVLRLLSDRKLEVRELSSKIICGFLHCLLVPEPMELLKSFQKTTQTFKRNRQRAKDGKRAALIPEEIDTAHSAILGLCAFVDTHPYHVPAFLPDILVVLTTHLHDPQPIPATIRKCLSDFRRTHHDNWAIHKTKFTEDQLCILTDIFVSPCYYA
ncbi:proteasome activator complex subunit 4A isoform X3 [Folsomia candida]|nr:proteasome activator complex subunit 4A isoform X3 [Folsomia candida]XP_035710342.1 proteasome activator complex subunit 4A isoform X3 [Folsomia candida]